MVSGLNNLATVGAVIDSALLSVALLLAGTGSVTPAGAVTVAVLSRGSGNAACAAKDSCKSKKAIANRHVLVKLRDGSPVCCRPCKNFNR